MYIFVTLPKNNEFHTQSEYYIYDNPKRGKPEFECQCFPMTPEERLGAVCKFPMCQIS